MSAERATHRETLRLPDETLLEFLTLGSEVLLQPLDVEEEASDYNPYWGEIWPSAVALANWVATMPVIVADRRVMELGCGVGVGSVVAAHLGAREVLAVDLMVEALDLVEINAEAAGLETVVQTAVFDWRRDAIPRGMDVLLAADVLYDRAAVAAVTELLTRRTPAGLELLLVEPGRDVASGAADALRRGGWELSETRLETPGIQTRRPMRGLRGRRWDVT